MDKAPDAYRTISEVGEDLDIAQHVLRFWETRFPQIKPLKRGGGRRYYRPDDVELLKGIRHLLYREGYTIKGVQRILKEQGPRGVQAVGKAGSLVPGFAPADPEDIEPGLAAPVQPVYAVPPMVAPEPAYRPSQGFGDVTPPPSFKPETVIERPTLPLDLPVAPRPHDGQVAYTRGGIGKQHDAVPAYSPPLASRETENSPKLALIEALGELESARAAIGRVLAGRERSNGK
ncbi:MAG: MerR family transcriptional regulator [Rhabdaerophilum sp.]